MASLARNQWECTSVSASENHFAIRMRNACDIRIQKFDVVDLVHIFVNMGAVTIIGEFWYDIRTIYTSMSLSRIKTKRHNVQYKRKWLYLSQKSWKTT